MFYPFLANVDASCIQESLKGLEDGVYYGYAKVDGNDGHAEPMVMSIGQNITFEDAKAKTAVRSFPQLCRIIALVNHIFAVTCFRKYTF